MFRLPVPEFEAQLDPWLATQVQVAEVRLCDKESTTAAFATADGPVLYRLPTSYARTPTIKATTATGRVTASAKGGHPLLRACRALVRYLP